eukprot:CAMPEP_0119134360 /NCGR_PEP_ID=MMETSP1310-20130426/16646_1 /TAXON_ID=464262 /ORGANISM="Genus nov. species nov., Strain RCC2339" /LENGTH=76 /DNA_ID=CAMNT_0007125149 /DNA_START=65 /DNA_END=295 /DNA_ORIENTATION=+
MSCARDDTKRARSMTYSRFRWEREEVLTPTTRADSAAVSPSSSRHPTSSARLASAKSLAHLATAAQSRRSSSLHDS